MLSNKSIFKPEGKRLRISSLILRLVFVAYDSTPSRVRRKVGCGDGEPRKPSGRGHGNWGHGLCGYVSNAIEGPSNSSRWG